MPILTFEEFKDNLHNWLNNLIPFGVRPPRIQPEEAEGFVELLEEWQHGLFAEDFPELKRLKQGISSFCEKIRDDKRVCLDVRARAAIFVFPDEDEDVVAEGQHVVRQGVPQGWDDALREYRARMGLQDEVVDVVENEGYVE